MSQKHERPGNSAQRGEQGIRHKTPEEPSLSLAQHRDSLADGLGGRGGRSKVIKQLIFRPHRPQTSSNERPALFYDLWERNYDEAEFGTAEAP